MGEAEESSKLGEAEQGDDRDTVEDDDEAVFSTGRCIVTSKG